MIDITCVANVEISHAMVKPSGMDYISIIRSTFDVVSTHHNLQMFWTNEVMITEQILMTIYPFYEYRNTLIQKYINKVTIHCFVFGVGAINVMSQIKGQSYSPDTEPTTGLRGFIRYLETIRGNTDPIFINYLHTSDTLVQALEAYQCLYSHYPESDQAIMNMLCKTILPVSLTLSVG